MNIPCGVANFVIDPLFNLFILNGDNMADATFGPGLVIFFAKVKINYFQVNWVFSGLSLACTLFVFYSVLQTKKKKIEPTR